MVDVTVCEAPNGMVTMLVRLLRDDRGSNAIEYGLIAAIISLAIVAGAGATSTGLGDLFVLLKNQAQNVVNGLPD